jgi:beta-glucosidase
VLYGEDVYVGYRYYEKIDSRPLFPFGHGLSYSRFELQNLRTLVNEKVEISLQVSNTGPCAGAEVVQVYVAPPATTSIGRPLKELKAFHKISLKAQESRAISIEFDTVLSTSYWDEGRDQWCSEVGEYKVLVGTSSADTPLEASFALNKTKYWRGVAPLV